MTKWVRLADMARECAVIYVAVIAADLTVAKILADNAGNNSPKKMM